MIGNLNFTPLSLFSGEILTQTSAPKSDENSFTVTRIGSTLNVPSATNNGPVSFSTNAGILTSLTAVSESSLSPPPPSGSYPFGFFNWSITNFLPATSVTVTMTLPSALPAGSQYEKLVGGKWVAVTTLLVPESTIPLTIEDDGLLDADPTVGVISDPVGLLVKTTPGKVTGEGKIDDNTNFGFDVNSKDGTAFKGHLEYHDKKAHIDLDNTQITLLSVDNSLTNAFFMGQAKSNGENHDDDKKSNAVARLGFSVSVTDPDKTGNHDQFSITVTDSSGKIAYQNSGTVHGHIEIHKVGTGDNEGDKDNHNDNGDNNDNNSN